MREIDFQRQTRTYQFNNTYCKLLQNNEGFSLCNVCGSGVTASSRMRRFERYQKSFVSQVLYEPPHSISSSGTERAEGLDA